MCLYLSTQGQEVQNLSILGQEVLNLSFLGWEIDHGLRQDCQHLKWKPSCMRMHGFTGITALEWICTGSQSTNLSDFFLCPIGQPHSQAQEEEEKGPGSYCLHISVIITTQNTLINKGGGSNVPITHVNTQHLFPWSIWRFHTKLTSYWCPAVVGHNPAAAIHVSFSMVFARREIQ